MKNISASVMKLSRRAKIIYGAVLIIVIVGGYFMFWRSDERLPAGKQVSRKAIFA